MLKLGELGEVNFGTLKYVEFNYVTYIGKNKTGETGYEIE